MREHFGLHQGRNVRVTIEFEVRHPCMTNCNSNILLTFIAWFIFTNVPYLASQSSMKWKMPLGIEIVGSMTTSTLTLNVVGFRVHPPMLICLKNDQILTMGPWLEG